MAENMRLKGKNAFVTGGGNGIGKAIALLLGRHGANVMVNDLGTDEAGEGSDATPAEQTAAEIAASGGTAATCMADVATFDGAGKVVSDTEEAFGQVDIAVNCAGAALEGSIFEMSEEFYHKTIALQMSQKWFIARHAVPRMVAQGWGRVVNTTSHGAMGDLGQPAFAAAMGGLSVLALLGALASPALSWPPPQATEPTRPSQALSELAAAAWSCLRSPPRRSLLLLGAGSRLIMTLLIALTSLYLQDRLDASAWGLGVIAGFVLALHWTSQIAAGPIMGALSDRVGRTRALAALVLALAVALALSGRVRGNASLLGMGAVMLLFSGLRVVIEAAASDAARAEAEPHLFMGVFTTADDWAAAMGPILGLSWFRIDLIPPFFTGCALLLLALGFNYRRSLRGAGLAT